MASSYKKAVQEAKAEIDSVIVMMQRLDTSILATSNHAAAMAKNLGSANFKNFNTSLELQTKLMKSLGSQVNRQTSNYKQLRKAKQNYNKAAKRTSYLMELSKVNAAAFNAAVKEQAKLVSKNVGEFEKLNIKLKQQKKAWQDALASQKASATELKKLEGAYRRTQAEIKKINDSVNAKVKLSIKERLAAERQKASEKALADNIKLRAQATASLVAPLNQLIAKQKLLRNEIQNGVATGRLSGKELKKLQARYVALTAKINMATNATGRFRKRGLSGIIGGLKNLAGAFGIVGGAFLAADMITKVFNLTKKLQSLDFALITVTKTQTDFARAQGFVSEISNKFGSDILSTTERYTKFLAAAQQSAVSLEDTEKIFSTVTKASGVLGLKTDELTGVYLALEQMMSKGKVTTEELRRQLGERLPGAFGIMASSIGVSIRELDEMLKKGEIMSSEVLPGFADELERVYGLDRFNQIETIQAAQNRMNNSFIELVHIFTEGSLSDVTMDFLNGIAHAVHVLGEGLVSIKEGFESLSVTWGIARDGIRDLINAFDPSGETWEKIVFYIKAIGKAFTTPGGLMLGDFFKELSVFVAGYIGIMKEMVSFFRGANFGEILKDPIKQFQKFNNTIGEGFSKGVEEFKKRSKELEIATKAKERADQLAVLVTRYVQYQRSLGDNMTAEKANIIWGQLTIEQIIEKREEIERLLAAQQKEKKDIEEGNHAMEGSVAWYKEQISTLTKKRDNLATTTEEYAKMTAQINTLKEAIEELEGQMEEKPEEGSIAWLEEQISALEKSRTELKKTNEEYQAIGEQIRLIEEMIEAISGDFRNDVAFDPFPEEEETEEKMSALMESLNELNDLVDDIDSDDDFFGIMLQKMADDTKYSLDEVEELWKNHWDQSAQGAIDFYDKLVAKQAAYQSFLKDTVAMAGETFGDLYDMDLTKFVMTGDTKEEKMMEWAAAGKEIIYGATEFALKQYEVELAEAVRTRDVILNDELATEEQKQEARRRFKEEEAQIRNKQAKAERQATLIRIAADTAQGVISALAQAPKFDGGISAGILAAFIAAQGAAQAAIVAAQPLPQFAEGHLSGTYEGNALINDANRSDYQEVIKRNDGGIEIHKDRNKVIDMKKGDKVYSSLSQFAQHHNMSDIAMMNMLSDGRELSFANSDRRMISEVSMMRSDMKTTWKEVKKLAKRPVNVRVSNKIQLNERRKYV